jgi:hypothetical protein
MGVKCWCFLERTIASCVNTMCNASSTVYTDGKPSHIYIPAIKSFLARDNPGLHTVATLKSLADFVLLLN